MASWGEREAVWLYWAELRGCRRAAKHFDEARDAPFGAAHSHPPTSQPCRCWACPRPVPPSHGLLNPPLQARRRTWPGQASARRWWKTATVHAWTVQRHRRGRTAHPEILAGCPRWGARLLGVEPGSSG
eukprot:scaffold51300_cov46-Phaeocystis_antarctica.AAC.1